MMVYVEWKIDITKPSKINIINININKDPNLKYEISNHTNILGKVSININNLQNYLHMEKIFFTRVKIGNLKTNNLYLLTYESMNNFDFGLKEFKFYLFGTKNMFSTVIKSIHKNVNSLITTNNFMNYNNDLLLSYDEINKMLNKYVIDIKKNNIQIFTDHDNKDHILYLEHIEINNQI